jgi:hypothetical protein
MKRRQLPASLPQRNSVLPEQRLPSRMFAGHCEIVGGFRHVQSAEPALPRQGLSALQVPALAVTQPLLSLVQCANEVSL